MPVLAPVTIATRPLWSGTSASDHLRFFVSVAAMAQNIPTRVAGRWVGDGQQMAFGGGDRSQIRSARRRVENVITGLAHTGVCVPDCEAAVAFYRDVLGLRVLSPPYVMAGNAIRDDMGELVSDPTMKAAIVGFGDDSDRVLEVIEYLGLEKGEAGGDQPRRAALTDHGLSPVGLICEDLDATRAELESRGVRFLVSGIADVARVRTTWFVDPWGVVFILVEKSRPERPYFSQWG